MNNKTISGLKCILYLFGLLAVALPAHAASFDCGKAASKIEKLICANDELSKLDETLSKTYQQALARSGDDKLQETEEQRRWLKANRAICQDAACLKEQYLERIHDLTEYSYTPAHFGACETDTNHTMQQIIDDGVMNYLSKHLGPPDKHLWTDGKLVDFYRVPKGISFKPISGTYVNVRPSVMYILPEIDHEFRTFGISCRIDCNFQIKPKCEVVTRQGVSMLAYREKNGKLIYVPKDDFERLTTIEKKLH